MKKTPRLLAGALVAVALLWTAGMASAQTIVYTLDNTTVANNPFPIDEGGEIDYGNFAITNGGITMEPGSEIGTRPTGVYPTGIYMADEETAVTLTLTLTFDHQVLVTSITANPVEFTGGGGTITVGGEVFNIPASGDDLVFTLTTPIYLAPGVDELVIVSENGQADLHQVTVQSVPEPVVSALLLGAAALGLLRRRRSA